VGPVVRAGLLVALLLLAACGSDGSTAAQQPRYDLKIEYWPAGSDGEMRTATLTCDPDGGSHPDPARACDALLENEDALEPVSRDVACTQIYGGNEVASVTGEGVSAALSRVNGCEIARWDRLEPVLELPG
jgi:hypothetical protein